MSAEGQRLAALDKANEIRQARAFVKNLVRERQMDIGEAMSRKAVAKMPIGDPILCLPQTGAFRVERVLRKCQVSWGRPVGMVTERERACLLDCLKEIGR